VIGLADHAAFPPRVLLRYAQSERASGPRWLLRL